LQLSTPGSHIGLAQEQLLTVNVIVVSLQKSSTLCYSHYTVS